MTMDDDLKAMVTRVEEIQKMDDSDFTFGQKAHVIIELGFLTIMSFCIYGVWLAKKVREWWRE